MGASTIIRITGTDLALGSSQLSGRQTIMTTFIMSYGRVQNV